MKSFILTLLIALTMIIMLNALPPLPSCYYTYDQIVTELFQLEAEYPSIVKVYNIGYSQQDSIPIYALKLSNQVTIEQFEPAVLFIGQVHAEEVLGVQVVMSNIKEIIQNRTQLQYRDWMAKLEMWFIPTLNPEGHNIVTSNVDVSYRKNKRDVNNNGFFDPPNPLVGYDLDGVDINRNFAFNWVHGDTLYHPGGDERYDYYRGEAPMSESEVQALWEFCKVQKPIYSIIWHSSRNPNSGLFEKVFYPGNYYGVRPFPDLALGQQIGTGVAAQIIKENGSGGYAALPAEGRKGGTNDFLYQQFGTIPLVIECGTNNLQPDSTLMVQTVTRATNGVKWMLNRALPTSSAVPSSSLLKGIIKDAVTGAPLEAEIIVMEKHAPWFAPRKSDPLTGRYYRPISNGEYTLKFRKKGYLEFTWANFTVNNGSETSANVELSPLPAATVSGEVLSSITGNLIPAKITLFDVENESVETDGNFILNSFQGQHRIEVYSEGYYPYIDTLTINQGVADLHLSIVMTPVTTIFSEDWENGMENWTKNGPWVLQNTLSVAGNAVTDSWGGKGFYAENCDVWIQTANPISIPSTGNPMLIFDQHLYTEFIFDPVSVQVSADTLDWQTIYTNSGQFDWWHPVYLPLNEFGGNDLYFRFRLTDQSTNIELTDPGWTLDNIRIVTGSATPNYEQYLEPVPVTVLYQNYPNPFNPETTIKFSLNKDSKVALDVYNLKGQKVKQLTNQPYKSGTHTLHWNGTDANDKPVASGIYFYKLTSGNKTKTQKMMLLK